MAKTKKTKEEILQKKREAERARYQRIKNDPQKYEQQKEKERLKYLKKKEKGQVKAAKDMTRRENRVARKRWRENVAAFRQRQAVLKDVTANCSGNTSVIAANGASTSKEGNNKRNDRSLQDGRKLAARKRSEKIRKNRTKVILRQKEKIIQLKKKVNKYKKRLQRAKKEKQCDGLTPNTKVISEVDNLLAKPSQSAKERVTKSLLFGEVIKQQLQENYSTLNTSRDKDTFVRAVSGKLVRKYKVYPEIGDISRKRIMKAKEATSLLYHGRKSRKDRVIHVIKSSVVRFLEEDNNSRLCAGKKEYLTKNKEKRQKRFLLDTMKGLHKKYILSDGAFQISYSLFCKLRPFWIVQPKMADRDTCLCIIHSNLDLILESLSNANIISIRNYQGLFQQICCDCYNETCLGQKCQTCRDRYIKFREFDNSVEINLRQWTVVSELITDKTKNPRKIRKYTKQMFKISPKDAVQKLLNSLDKFLKHQINIVHQYKEIKLLKEQLTDEECIIHMDFSENYNTKYSQEIQSFHFGGSRRQISLHTVVIYTRNLTDSTVNTSCICTLSLNLTHGPAGIWAHLKPVFELIPHRVTSVHFLSDGPVTQYRNKTMFYMLACQLSRFYPQVNRFSWNFHEAGHGKGAPDGVGAVCKRTKIIEENCHSIKTFVIKDSDIEEMELLIKENEKAITSFAGTLQVHQAYGNQDLPNKIILKSLSCFCCKNGCDHFKLGELDYSGKKQKLSVDDIFTDSEEEQDCEVTNKLIAYDASVPRAVPENANVDEPDDKTLFQKTFCPGDYVLVKYLSRVHEYRYVAVCFGEIDEQESEIKVRFFKLCNASKTEFKITDEILFISLDQILQKLPIPTITLKGDRCFYKFVDPIDVFEQ